MKHQTLTNTVQQLLPEAHISAYTLPACPLQLYLINDDYPRGPLPAEVANAIMEQPYYWAFCWAAGLVLAQQIMQNPHWVEGKTVLDFGSGSGVAGIAAAMAGAKQVIACDQDPLAQQATRINAELNNVDVDVVGFYEHTEKLDVLLAADILYDRDNLPLLPSFRQWASTIWLSDSRVKNFSQPGFTKVGTFEATTLPDLGELEEFKRVNLYRG